jgi:deoxyribodipyrimidine photolyase
MHPGQPFINTVWFKRDLRLADHAPLQAACKAGLAVILLYVVEPSQRQNPHLSLRQAYQKYRANRQNPGWDRSLRAFASRLHWHCHFIQKFESECANVYRSWQSCQTLYCISLGY